jgi:hypothetical protein
VETNSNGVVSRRVCYIYTHVSNIWRSRWSWRCDWKWRSLILFFCFCFFHSEKEKENEKNYPINFCPFVDEIKRHTQKIKIKRAAEQMNWRSIANSLSWFASQNIQQKRGRNTHTHTQKKSQTGARSFGWFLQSRH